MPNGLAPPPSPVVMLQQAFEQLRRKTREQKLEEKLTCWGVCLNKTGVAEFALSWRSRVVSELLGGRSLAWRRARR